MPRVRLTKSAIDALPTFKSDVVYWDSGCPGFGVKVTPSGRKVFIVLYRTGGAGSKLRKYTIHLYGRVTLHQSRCRPLRLDRDRSADPSYETLPDQLADQAIGMIDVRQAFAQNADADRDRAIYRRVETVV